MNNFYDDKLAFTKRIDEIVEILGNSNLAAKKIGVTASSVIRWQRGEADPSRTNLVKLSEAANVNVAWLATGEGAKFKDLTQLNENRPQKALDVLGRPVNIDEFVFIPLYMIEASAGYGNAVDSEDNKLVVAFRKYWIHNYLNADPKDLSVIKIRGDSMQGVLNNGDSVLINHKKTTPKDGLFILRIDGSLFAKRLQVLPDNKLLIKSANKEYEPFTIDAKHPPDDFKIIGEIEWIARQV